MPEMLRPEIEYWYVVPFIRKSIVKNLRLLGLPQKEIAFMLNITPSAVSQYLHNKRAMIVEEECPEEARKINRFIEKKLGNRKDANLFVVQAELLMELEEKEIICNVHKKIEHFEECGVSRCQ